MKLPAGEPDSTNLLERATICALLASPWSMGKVAELLTAGDFSSRAHKEIFSQLLTLHSQGAPPDYILLTARLIDAGKLSVVKAVAELSEVGGAALGPHLAFYIDELLKKNSSRRRALELVQSSNTNIGEEARRAPPG
jgi:replicative DNA helicase